MRFLLDTLIKPLAGETGVDREHWLKVATATLLLEVVRADFEVQAVEMVRLESLLRERFGLDRGELAQIISEARLEADQLVSLQHLTRRINEYCSETEKVRVIEMMWEIVFADGHLDHYEEHLIRQVADLLYLPHSAFIQARHKAEPPVL